MRNEKWWCGAKNKEAPRSIDGGDARRWYFSHQSQVTSHSSLLSNFPYIKMPSAFVAKGVIMIFKKRPINSSYKRIYFRMKRTVRMYMSGLIFSVLPARVLMMT